MGSKREAIGRKVMNAVVAGGSVLTLEGTDTVVVASVGACKPEGGVCTVGGIHSGPESGWGVGATRALEQRTRHQ